MSTPTLVFQRTRPELTIRYIKSVSMYRSYSETDYEVVSTRQLDAAAFKALDSIRMLGFGQAYSVTKEEIFEEVSVPTWIDYQGKALVEITDVQKTHLDAARAQPFTHIYYRYIVRRICDSGD